MMDSGLVGALLSLENDRERRPEIPFYQEGIWTPTWTSLTVVGAPTYAGRYTRIGDLVFWQVLITAGGANTTASTAGVTGINNLPFTIAHTNNLSVSNANTGIAIGDGHIGGVGTQNANTPTWAATNANITISGWYEI